MFKQMERLVALVQNDGISGLPGWSGIAANTERVPQASATAVPDQTRESTDIGTVRRNADQNLANLFHTGMRSTQAVSDPNDHGWFNVRFSASF